MLILTVVSNFQGGAESNMAVLEVSLPISLPSGYIADKDGFANILIVERVKKVETKNEDTVIIIYFESLTEEDV
uniref:Alpha-macroglobulin receptor-binding domain-containing protein n=1 Tax=Megaselia scalaris TaxID=36166 RepID=T1H1Z6_MEGSC